MSLRSHNQTHTRPAEMIADRLGSPHRGGTLNYDYREAAKMGHFRHAGPSAEFSHGTRYDGRAMATLTISLTEERSEQLRMAADRLGMTAEDLARAGIEALLAQPGEDFERAVDLVLRKNADLYRRLA